MRIRVFEEEIAPSPPAFVAVTRSLIS